MKIEQLASIIKEHFSAQHITVENQSFFHRTHAHGAQESHFKIWVVSKAFEGLGQVARHQKVFQALKGVEFHALSIEAFSPLEWERRQKQHAQSN